ncbi:MAG TPA: acetoacetate decarboxylase family protein [Acidimicrobiales bacterium]|nr:acetoacetate decarboxylase family protein [Acidimicrobiales bacterium]
MADAPWVLHGEGLLAWLPRPPGGVTLPPGLSPAPGLAAVVGMRYDDSPVGPYSELSVLVPARLGLRPGWCTVTMVVTSADARRACRGAWGLPAELGGLYWTDAEAGAERSVSWSDRGVTLSGRAHGPAVLAPLVPMPVRSVGWRAGDPVVLARRLRARARFAHCEVEVKDGDDLAWAAGRHRGLDLAGARIVAAPARRPAGLLSSVPWPERAVAAPEPAG